MPDILELIGNRIREVRKGKSLSQEQLGEISGFHYTYIGGLERGERNISILNLEKIANSLEVDISEFFNFEEYVPEDTEQLLNEVMSLLNNRPSKDILMAKNILIELFKHK